MPHLVPLIPAQPPADRDAEIAQIARELEILRARYALYGRMGRVLRIFFIVTTPLLVIALSAVAVKFVLRDAVSGAWLAASLLVFCAVIFVLVRNSDLRWIDVASMPSRATNPCFYDPANSGARFLVFGRLPSDARIIEVQIAERERRLAELETI